MSDTRSSTDLLLRENQTITARDEQQFKTLTAQREEDVLKSAAVAESCTPSVKYLSDFLPNKVFIEVPKKKVISKPSKKSDAMLDKAESEEAEQSCNSWKIGGMLAAFLSLVSYTGSNYVAGTQTGDIFAGKVANSLSLGVFGIVYIVLMIRSKDHRFLKAFKSVTNIFGNSHQSFTDEDVTEIRKALVVSLLCGFMNAIGMTSLYIALNDASSHNFNISI